MTADEPVGGENAARRWEIFLAVVAAGVVVATLAATEESLGLRLAAAAAIAAIAALYALWGRQFVAREQPDRAAVFIGIVVVIFGAATYLVSTVSYLLFALSTLIFLVLPLRRAAPAAVVASFTPLATALLRDGWSGPLFLNLAPVFLVSAALAVFLGTFINRVIEQSQERASLITELRRSRAEVARLSREAGAAAERERLAGEIHDTLAQGFTSIVTLVQAADPALKDERLALAVRTARENLAESRALIAALSPVALTDATLAEAVRRQVETFGAGATVRVTGEPRTLPTAVEVVLLRATQEALSNVRRHAQAGAASVLLAYAEKSVRLVVRDDGRGFDPAHAGFGLNTMRSRAEQVRGSLVVRSDPRTGTTVELEVPA